MTDFLRDMLTKDGVNVALEIEVRPEILGSYFVTLPLDKIGTYIDACIGQHDKWCNDRNECDEQTEKDRYDERIAAICGDIDSLYKDYGVVAKRMIREGKLVKVR